jgi:hypothetical protein
MRSLTSVSLVSLSLLVLACCPKLATAALDDKQPDAQSIAALEVKASQAQPREQCYIYAELVHEMIEFSSAQYAAGELEKASQTLRQVSGLARKIHIAMANDEKRLKNTQILLRHTAFRLNELLHASSEEDRPLVQQTLADLNQVQTETMMQVFRK